MENNIQKKSEAVAYTNLIRETLESQYLQYNEAFWKWEQSYYSKYGQYPIGLLEDEKTHRYEVSCSNILKLEKTKELVNYIIDDGFVVLANELWVCYYICDRIREHLSSHYDEDRDNKGRFEYLLALRNLKADLYPLYYTKTISNEDVLKRLDKAIEQSFSVSSYEEIRKTVTECNRIVKNEDTEIQIEKTILIFEAWKAVESKKNVEHIFENIELNQYLDMVRTADFSAIKMKQVNPIIYTIYRISKTMGEDWLKKAIERWNEINQGNNNREPIDPKKASTLSHFKAKKYVFPNDPPKENR